MASIKTAHKYKLKDRIMDRKMKMLKQTENKLMKGEKKDISDTEKPFRKKKELRK